VRLIHSLLFIFSLMIDSLKIEGPKKYRFRGNSVI
jgi:hypothetical protein